MKRLVILILFLLSNSNIILGQLKANFFTKKTVFLGKEINIINAIANLDQNKITDLHDNYTAILFSFYFPSNLDINLKKDEIKQLFSQDSVYNFLLKNSGDIRKLTDFLFNKITNSTVDPTIFYLAKNNAKFNLLDTKADLIWFSMPIINKKFLKTIDKITIGGQMDFLFDKNILIKKDKSNFYFRKFSNSLSGDYSSIKSDFFRYKLIQQFERCIMVIDKNFGIVDLVEFNKIPFAN